MSTLILQAASRSTGSCATRSCWDLPRGRLGAGGKSSRRVRVLAEESGVNTMTVSRAYQQLKAEGYLRTDRRGGSVLIRPDGQPGATAEQRERLRLCLSELRLAGLHKDEILALCARALRR